MAVKSSISLTIEQYAFAKALVEAGRYPSLSAVLQQGVDLLRVRMDAEELETAALRELLSRRRTGAFVDSDRRKDESSSGIDFQCPTAPHSGSCAAPKQSGASAASESTTAPGAASEMSRPWL